MCSKRLVAASARVGTEQELDFAEEQEEAIECY
jgi:hypothetical protein